MSRLTHLTPSCVPPKAPCPPQGLTAVSHCGNDSLLATWTASLGATSYTTTVTGPGGFSQNCSSSPSPTCSVSGLQCASQYKVRVTSQNSHCSSPPAETFVTTGCLLIYGSILFIHIIRLKFSCTGLYPNLINVQPE